ncbi:hypothetical protein [Paraferrimonas sedimenticola]|uniref:Uncharacterized protein n=1 Tax=Paraferrimonas sedimenticola TaxID=375674 RepID=A0AA37RUB3_9GAMM|nr:hypothetical protein [Paraferrimonas sedimenticola]GLP95286.1 hypothetical protein GCM10007895_05920 [Paraferrimonas sedimenticola]
MINTFDLLFAVLSHNRRLAKNLVPTDLALVSQQYPTTAPSDDQTPDASDSLTVTHNLHTHSLEDA